MTSKQLTIIDCVKALAEASKKFILYISFDPFFNENLYLGEDTSPMDEICKAAPYLSPRAGNQILYDGQGIIICDSEEELNNLFWQTVGDDGPTYLNPYNGPARVYALTIHSDGECYNENT